MRDNSSKIGTIQEHGNILLDHVGKVIRVSDCNAHFTVYGTLTVTHYNRDMFTVTLANDGDKNYASAAFFAEDVWFIVASPDNPLNVVLN